MAGETLPPVVAVLQGDISDLVAKIAEAKKEVESLDGVTGTAKAELDLASLATSIAEAEAMIRAFSATTGHIDMSASINMAPAMAEFAAAAAAMRAVANTDGGGPGNGGLLALLGWGGGAFGFAAFGSVLSLAGFGFEHLATIVLGLAGSLAGALTGAAILAAGALARMAVGMGSDMLVMLEANQAVKALIQGIEATPSSPPAVKALAALAAGTLTLTQATLLYGKAAAQAQYQTAQLTITTDLYWLHSISGALIQISTLKDSLLGLAQQYIPLVAAAAQKNFAIMNQAFQPLIAWIDGPGKAAFIELENLFASQLPTSIHAMTQAFELFVKVLVYAAQQGGGFVLWLDAFFTKWNAPGSWPQVVQGINTVVGMFRDWWDLLKQVGITIFDLFKQSVGLGTTIVTTITAMLKELDAWLVSTSGSNAVHSLFAVHLAEIQALLAILPTVIGAFGQVYLAIAPVLVELAAGIATVVGWMLKIPVVGPILAWGAAIAFLWSKMNLLATEVKLVTFLNSIYTAAVAMPAAFMAWATGADEAAVATATLGTATEATAASTEALAAPTGLAALLNPIGLLTIGVEALAVGVAIAVLNWGSWTKAIWAMNNPLRAAQLALQAFDDQAAKNYLTYLTNNFQQFSDAVTRLAQGPIANTVPQAFVNLNAQFQANSAAIAKLTSDTNNFVNTGNKFGNAANGISSAEFAAAKNGQVWNTVYGQQILGLQQLINGYGSLAPNMQGVINEMVAGKASNDALVATYRAFNQVLPQTILSNSELRAGISQSTIDYYAAVTALTTLAAKQTGPEHAATMQQIADLKATQQAQAARYNAALPQWNAEVLAYENIALQQGKSTAAALAWATAQASKVDPAGAAAQAEIQLYANSLHTSLANAEALVNANPAILQAFINQQNAIKNNLVENANLAKSLQGVVGNVQNLINAIDRLNATPINIKTTGGYIPGLAHGGIVNADASGTMYALHGVEAVIPKDMASPAMWAAIQATLGGKSSPMPITGGGIMSMPAGPAPGGIMSMPGGSPSVGRGGGGSLPGGAGFSANYNITINMPAGAATSPQIMKAVIVQALEQHDNDLMRQMGGRPRVGAMQ